MLVIRMQMKVSRFFFSKRLTIDLPLWKWSFINCLLYCCAGEHCYPHQVLWVVEDGLMDSIQECLQFFWHLWRIFFHKKYFGKLNAGRLLFSIGSNDHILAPYYVVQSSAFSITETDHQFSFLLFWYRHYSSNLLHSQSSCSIIGQNLVH